MSSINLNTPKGSGHEIIDVNGQVKSSGTTTSDKEMISPEGLSLVYIRSGLFTMIK